MSHDLEKEIRLVEEASPHGWHLEEIDSKGGRKSGSFTPWQEEIYFTASELRLEQQVYVHNSDGSFLWDNKKKGWTGN